MAESLRYPVPATRFRAEVVIERSRFICTVAHAAAPEEAQAFIRATAEEFADATHNCWAFVAGPPGSTGRIGMSDDGEPHGTAGRPMLTVLLHSGVGEIVAVVTRYFGGTKLGTGGLARAYAGAVQEALAGLPRHERVERTEVGIRTTYAHFATLRHRLAEVEGDVVAESFGADVVLSVRLPVERLGDLRRLVGDATGGQGELLAPGGAGDR